MAIPRRTAGEPYLRQAIGRRPIVLARLPYVGTAARAESQEKDSSAQSEHELRTKHGRRHRKHESVSQERSQERPQKKLKGWSSKASSQASRSTGLAASFSQLQSQLMPHSGVLIGSALIVSASLLYWMVADPSHVPADFHDTGWGGLQASTAQLPKYDRALPAFVARTDTTQVPDSETKSDGLSWRELGESSEVVSAAPHEENRATSPHEQEWSSVAEESLATLPVSQTPIEQTMLNTTEQTVSPPEGPIFPTTDRPAALDFAKIAGELKRL